MSLSSVELGLGVEVGSLVVAMLIQGGPGPARQAGVAVVVLREVDEVVRQLATNHQLLEVRGPILLVAPSLSDL